jgi:hypothetical protein
LNKAHITLASKDDKNYQLAQVTYMGKTIDIEVLNPYGFCSNPPLDALGVLFNIQNAENVAGVFNVPVQRFKNLKEWEVQIGNYKTQSSVKFNDNGDVQLNAKDGKLAIGNNEEELIALLDELNTAIEAITVATQAGPTTPINNKASFTAFTPRIAKLKGSL